MAEHVWTFTKHALKYHQQTKRIRKEKAYILWLRGFRSIPMGTVMKKVVAPRVRTRWASIDDPIQREAILKEVFGGL